MDSDMDRRDFLASVPAAAFILMQATRGAAPAASGLMAAGAPGAVTKLEPFDYDGVRLLEGRWQQQYQAGRDRYFGVSDDDILHGYRAAAGLPAPGKPLGGWCRTNSNTVFGQWLSGMARMHRATGDQPIRDKAVGLLRGWAKTVGADGDCRMDTYAYDKLVCGLVDLQLYAGVGEAIPLLERVTDWADRTFSRARTLRSRSDPTAYYGSPHEWYTLSENLYRAYQLTGNSRFARFAEVWLYHDYWNKFADTALPPDAQGAHAYSHVNTFSSAAKAYEVTGDARYLRICRNAYDYIQQTQCFATGGYGPSERFVTPNGSLGKSLDARADTAETPCGTWAGFKLSQYMLRLTGEAHYGDWAERLLYNGNGAALLPEPDGSAFYYADYRVGGGKKVPFWEAWPCCSGTFIQNIAAYHDIIYYKTDGDLYVNLYVPSGVTWRRRAGGGTVRLTQQTSYPEAELSTLTLELERPTRFALNFRVPSWTRDASVSVNGTRVETRLAPGTWGTLTREWHSGDRVDIRIPLVLRMVPVDQWHPDRVAVVRGPAVLVLEGDWHEPYFHLPKDDATLASLLVPDERAGAFRVQLPNGRVVRSKFRPFYDIERYYPYFMYMDRGNMGYDLW